MRPLIILFVLAPVLVGCGQREITPEAMCRNVIADKGFKDVALTSARYDRPDASTGASLTLDAGPRRLTCEVHRGKVVEVTVDGEIIYQDLK